jgi:hypothetical protein
MQWQNLEAFKAIKALQENFRATNHTRLPHSLSDLVKYFFFLVRIQNLQLQSSVEAYHLLHSPAPTEKT